VTSDDHQRDLADLVGRQAATLEVWQNAELCVLEVMLRERLALLDIEPTQELAVALMTTAQLLAERAPEWGGDARGTLAEVAVLGLRLLDPPESQEP
jgi:hypothetical protein